MKRNKPKSGAEIEKYQPSPRERAAIDKHNARRDANAPAPRLKVRTDGTATDVSLDHPSQPVATALLMEALGTTDADFVRGLIRQLADTSGQPDEASLNFLLTVVKDVKPNDQLVAMLAAQMAAIHVATLKLARELRMAETLQHHDSAAGALNKLARTFTTQMEALKRYRTGGEQKVTVQYVSVGEGGQAIVGNVTQATPKTAPARHASSTPALTDAQQPAMPIIGDRRRARVPLPTPAKK
jgi:hypothetical protein